MAPPPGWWFSQWESWQRFAFLHEASRPSARWTPSGCCSRTKCARLPAASQRKWDAADLGGCPPCPEEEIRRNYSVRQYQPGSWPSHFRWCRRAPLREWWSCQSGFWQRSAYQTMFGVGCSSIYRHVTTENLMYFMLQLFVCYTLRPLNICTYDTN